MKQIVLTLPPVTQYIASSTLTPDSIIGLKVIDKNDVYFKQKYVYAVENGYMGFHRVDDHATYWTRSTKKENITSFINSVMEDARVELYLFDNYLELAKWILAK